MFYGYCEEFELLPEGTCNVFTFSRSGLKWLTTKIQANYWVYAREVDYFDYGENTTFDDFDDFKAEYELADVGPPVDAEDFFFDWDGCEPISDMPAIYTQGTAISLKSQECAIKFQLMNRDVQGIYSFKVVRDSAVTLAAAAALISTMAQSF